MYVCGNYVKTAGANCQHNAVDGDAALKFVLNFLIEQIERLGGRNALKSRLEKLAKLQQGVLSFGITKIAAVVGEEEKP